MNTNSESEEEDELRSSPNPPAPRVSWLVCGGLLLLLGVLMLFSIVMTAVGIGMCVVGILMVLAAFLSDTGQGLRTKNESDAQANAHARKPGTSFLMKTGQRLKDHTDTANLQNDRLHTKRV